MAPLEAPYGMWTSPVTVRHASTSVYRLGEIQVAGSDVYWTEERPEEDGRVALVRRGSDGVVVDACPRDFSVRSTVYEYGGASFLAAGDTVHIVNFADQRIYRCDPGGGAIPLTEASTTLRYADLALDAARQRLVCLLERHPTGAGRVVHQIAAVPLAGGAPEVLVSGRDFYCSPRLSPDGDRLCWIEWSDPNLPWDATELWVADLDDSGRPRSPVRVAGGGDAESVVQPQWGADGALHYVSDRTGWWNIYRLHDGQSTPLTPLDVEFGRPQWVLHMVSYAFLDDRTLAAAGCDEGRWRMYVVNVDGSGVREVPTRFTDCGSVVRACEGRIVLDAASPTEVRAVVAVEPDTAAVEVLAEVRAAGTDLDPAYVSQPRAVTYDSEGQRTHAFFYPPHNPDYRAAGGERPPLIVRVHGGPTSSVTSMLDYSIQYWTSRGFAVLDVNYGGSSGYGRAYRERLVGRWGELDVADSCAGARYLVDRGEVDGDRLVISGGSAGGFTVLNAMAFESTFHVGTSYYGIADLEEFIRGTHKFEARYCDRLVGPYPEESQRYRERSALHAPRGVTKPLLIFQGLADPIVPAAQAEAMAHAVRDSGVPCGYLAFPDEQHGFRGAENLYRCIEAEQYFYGLFFGLGSPPADPPIEVANLDTVESRV